MQTTGATQERRSDHFKRSGTVLAGAIALDHWHGRRLPHGGAIAVHVLLEPPHDARPAVCWGCWRGLTALPLVRCDLFVYDVGSNTLPKKKSKNYRQ